MDAGDQTEPVATLGDGGTPPKTRIKDASAAHQLIAALERADGPRAKVRARTRGLLDGNPPYNPAKLRELGQSHRANLNFREASGYVKARKSSYYDLVMGVPQLVQIALRPEAARAIAERTGDDSAPARFSAIIGEEFHRLETEWSGFLFHTLRNMGEMVSNGVGPVFFPHERDWRFKSVAMGDVLVPDGAPANVGDMSVVAVRTSYSVVDLFERIADTETVQVSRDAGWNVELVRQSICKSYEQAGIDASNWEVLQERIAHNSLVEEFVGPAPVDVYQLFWREFSGKVSMAIVLKDAAEKRFLYKSAERFDSFERVLLLFFADIGDGKYHSVRGLGTSIYPHCEASNRFLNTMVDGAMMSASALLRQKSGQGPSTPKLLRVGPVTVLPPDFDVVDKGFNPNLQGVTLVRNILQANLNSNVGLFRPETSATSEGAGSPKTAKEVVAAAQKEAKLENTDIQFYYLQWDRLYREQLRRVLDPDLGTLDPGYDAAFEFRRRCIARGVPEQVLNLKYLDIKATRSIGAGSPVMKDINSRQLLELAPYLDRRGKYEAIRNRVIVLAGPENVERFLGDMDRDEIPVVDSSIARLESGMMRMGHSATAGSGEDHVAHAMEHLKAVEEFSSEVAAKRQRGADVDFAAAANYLRLTLNHVGEHADFLIGNPAFREDVEVLRAGMKQLSRIQARWDSEAQRQAAQQQQQQEEELRKLQAADGVEADIMKERIKADMQLRERIHNEERNHEVRSAKAVHGMQIKEAESRQRMELERRKAEAEIAHMEVKNAG